MATATDHTPRAGQDGDSPRSASNPADGGSGVETWAPPTGRPRGWGRWQGEPGWYPNPDGTRSRRWWDGLRWTNEVKPLGARKLTLAAAAMAFCLALLSIIGLVAGGHSSPTDSHVKAPYLVERAAILTQTYSYVTSAVEGAGLRVVSFDPDTDATVIITTGASDVETGAWPDTATVRTGVVTSSPYGSSVVHRTVTADLESNQGWTVTNSSFYPGLIP